MIKFIKLLLKYSYWLIPMIFLGLLFLCAGTPFNNKNPHDAMIAYGIICSLLLTIATVVMAYFYMCDN